MSIVLRLLLLFAVVAVPRGMAADASEAALLARLHQPAVLRGEFAQRRQIAGFRRPVESRGAFVVARGQGLLWHTGKPFESLLTINRERLRITNGSGGAATTMDAGREPMLRAVNEILQGVMIADIAALKRRFNISIRLVADDGWELGLQPRDAALRARFTSITLAGAAHVQNVRLAEANGDVTSLRLENQVEDVALTPDEIRKFQ